MKTKSILIIVISLAFLSVLIYFQYKKAPPIPSSNPPVISPFSDNLSCKDMYDEIEKDIDRANYCQNDSDCDVLILGGVYIDFGCYHFINKLVDKEQIYKKMIIYKQKCSQTIDKCAFTPASRCLSNKCVPLEK